MVSNVSFKNINSLADLSNRLATAEVIVDKKSGKRYVKIGEDSVSLNQIVRKMHKITEFEELNRMAPLSPEMKKNGKAICYAIREFKRTSNKEIDKLSNTAKIKHHIRAFFGNVGRNVKGDKSLQEYEDKHFKITTTPNQQEIISKKPIQKTAVNRANRPIATKTSEKPIQKTAVNNANRPTATKTSERPTRQSESPATVMNKFINLLSGAEKRLTELRAKRDEVDSITESISQFKVEMNRPNTPEEVENNFKNLIAGAEKRLKTLGSENLNNEIDSIEQEVAMLKAKIDHLKVKNTRASSPSKKPNSLPSKRTKSSRDAIINGNQQIAHLATSKSTLNKEQIKFIENCMIRYFKNDVTGQQLRSRTKLYPFIQTEFAKEFKIQIFGKSVTTTVSFRNEVLKILTHTMTITNYERMKEDRSKDQLKNKTPAELEKILLRLCVNSFINTEMNIPGYTKKQIIYVFRQEIALLKQKSELFQPVLSNETANSTVTEDPQAASLKTSFQPSEPKSPWPESLIFPTGWGTDVIDKPNDID